MRYYNYLNEDKDLLTLLKGNKIYDFYLQSRNYYLFRGIKKKIDTYEIITARKDRTPRDTPIEIHNKLDDAFNKKFGWKVRSEGVFVAGDYVEAKYYGNPHLFIPLDPFEYVHSNKIKDLYAHLETEEYIVDKKISKYNHLDDDTIKKIINTYKKNADLYEIILNQSEVIFKCNKYVLININYFQNMSKI